MPVPYIDPHERARMAWECAVIDGDKYGLVDMTTWLQIVTGVAMQAAAAEREACAAKAREFAEHYEQGSDGRNTFVLLAEWIEARSTLSE